MAAGIIAGLCTFAGLIGLTFLLVAWDAHREHKRRRKILEDLRRHHRG